MPNWTDSPISSLTRIKLVHITELRSIIDAAILDAGLPAFNWTDPVLSTASRVRAIHVNEMRTAIQSLWDDANMGQLPEWSVGSGPSDRRISARDINDLRYWFERYDGPTLIGAHFLNTLRNLHSKEVWSIELVYAQNGNPGVTDLSGVAARISAMKTAKKDVKILLRIDYSGPTAPSNLPQSIPPSNDTTARTDYYNFIMSVCNNDDINRYVTGFIIGNEFNAREENRGNGPPLTVTASWYSDVFIGSERSSSDQNNAYQIIKATDDAKLVLLGPVAPYNSTIGSDDGSQAAINMPWLNYFNEICNKLSSTADAKGINLESGGGIALHAYGRTGADGSENSGYNEPHVDVQGEGWATGAYSGFTVYQNWLDIIDGYVLGNFNKCPIFITEINTLQVINNQVVHSKDTYPDDDPNHRWYEQALNVIADENVGRANIIQCVCWFVDLNYDGHWGDDSLTNRVGRCAKADDDFNYLLAQ